MKLLLLITVCFTAVIAANDQNFNKEPEDIYTSDEALLFPYQTEDSFDVPDSQDSAAVGQISSNRNVINNDGEGVVIIPSQHNSANSQFDVDGDEDEEDMNSANSQFDVDGGEDEEDMNSANRQIDVDGDEDEEDINPTNRQINVDGDEDEEDKNPANRQIDVDGEEDEEDMTSANRQIDVDGEEDEEDMNSANRQIDVDGDEDEEDANSAYRQFHSGEDYKDFTSVDQQIVDMSDLLGRARRCRKSLGGRCQNKKTSCKKGYQASPKGRPYCASKHRICCYPAKSTTAAPTTTTPATTLLTTTTTTPTTTTTTTVAPTTTPKGCTLSYGEFRIGKQCFKMSLSKKNWASARSYCQGIGLDLAQPEDPVSMHKYIKQKGWLTARTWIGGRGTGSCYSWLNGTCIPDASPLWGWGPNGDKSSSWGINIHNSNTPDKPLDADSTTETKQVLCERK